MSALESLNASLRAAQAASRSNYLEAARHAVPALVNGAALVGATAGNEHARKTLQEAMSSASQLASNAASATKGAAEGAGEKASQAVQAARKTLSNNPRAAGALVGVAVASAAAPALLALAGFTSAGVGAGSLAAAYQSSVLGGTIVSGSGFAVCQSLGATGLPTLWTIGVGSVGAAGGAGLGHALGSSRREKGPDRATAEQSEDGNPASRL